MTNPDLVQVAERDVIIRSAAEEGIPEALAQQLARAGGERRQPGEILETAMWLTDDYVDREPTAQPVDNLLLTHFPGIVRSMVQDPEKRERVLELWITEGGQRDRLQAVVDLKAARNKA